MRPISTQQLTHTDKRRERIRIDQLILAALRLRCCWIFFWFFRWAIAEEREEDAHQPDGVRAGQWISTCLSMPNIDSDHRCHEAWRSWRRQSGMATGRFYRLDWPTTTESIHWIHQFFYSKTSWQELRASSKSPALGGKSLDDHAECCESQKARNLARRTQPVASLIRRK